MYFLFYFLLKKLLSVDILIWSSFIRLIIQIVKESMYFSFST